MGGNLVIGRRTPPRCTSLSSETTPGIDVVFCSFLTKSLVRSTSESLHHLLPLPNTLRQSYPSITTESLEILDQALENLAGLCHDLEGVTFSPMLPKVENHERFAMVIARENTWSRKARRRLDKRRRERAGGSASTAPEEHCETAVSLIIRSYFSSDMGALKSTDSRSCLVLEASWKKGKDRELFETFWSHLSRKFSDLVASTAPNRSKD